jgi:hypothetical protein
MIIKSPHYFVLYHGRPMDEKNNELMILLLPYAILSSNNNKNNLCMII